VYIERMTESDDVVDDRPMARASAPPLQEAARIFVIGLFMGTADGVPGVSGGTIALIAGIYERLIGAITAITPGRVVGLLRALTPLDGGPAPGRAVEILEEIDAWFVMVLLAGIGSAVVLVGQIVEYADEHAPLLLFGSFFGLIAASAVILLREISLETTGHRLIALAGFAVAFVLSGPVQVLEGGGLPVVFLAGGVAVSAMILPGISGSLMLVILGQYTRMYTTLGTFLDGLVGLVAGGGIERLLDPGREVVTFVLGGVVGLFTVARVVRRMLDADREATLAFLVALVVGALRAPVAELSSREGFGWTTTTIGEFALVAAVGAAAVLVLDWYAVDLDLEAV
jgi:putative membrane protein